MRAWTTAPKLVAVAAVVALGACSDDGSRLGGRHERVATPTFYPAGIEIPTTGPDVPGIAPFDTGIKALMRAWNVPGIAIAVAKDGRLIVARGYGYADFEQRQLMQPDTMTRIGSISKFLTALAILRLRDRGQLDLDQTFVSILAQYQVEAGGDARLANITLRHLLQHSGGWDRGITGLDIVNRDFDVAHALGIATPVTCHDVVRYAMTQPLQFAPGTRAAYSNFGFCILSRVVEHASGQSYESFVRDQVLAPAGVHAMSLARARLDERGPFEAKYYIHNGAPLRDSVFAGEGRVPPPYAIDPATSLGAGGWIGSAVDVTRVITLFEGIRSPGFLSDDSKGEMLANPNLATTADGYPWAAGLWLGLGLSVGPTAENYGHGGLMSGSQSLVLRLENGYVFTILANVRASTPGGLADGFVATMREAIGSGVAGSPTDLFAQYPSPSLPGRAP